MLKTHKILIISLVFLFATMNMLGISNKNTSLKTPKTDISYPAKKSIQNPLTAPKRLILNEDFIQVNSQDTIFVQTITFPLMSEAEQQFVGKVISEYRSGKIKAFIDAFYNRDKVKDEFYQNFPYIQKWSFDIVYQSQTELSLKLLNYEFTGGAHGNTSVKHFNFDLVNFKSYKLADKIKNLNLDKLAEYCTDYCLKNNIVIFDDQVKASPDLLKIWNFTKDGILLTFPQYSIGPYSSGIIEIFLPNNALINLQKKS